jgi:hypothetical protein
MTATFDLSVEELRVAVPEYVYKKYTIGEDSNARIDMHVAKGHSTEEYRVSATVRIEPRS